MQSKRLQIRHLWPVLCFVTASFIVAASSQPSCHESHEGAEKGIVRPPQFPASTPTVNCSWIFRAAPGFKLLVRVDIVEFVPSNQRSSSLTLTADNEVYEIGRNCVTCLTELVAGEVIRIDFVSVRVASSKSDASVDGNHSQPYTGSFQIRYKAFNPSYCDRPRSPNNGYVYGKDWKVGSEITYHCSPPYDLIGGTRAQCTVPEQTLEPEWSRFPPRCLLADCRRGIIRRYAGAGAIASPGYQEKRLPAARKCEWEITSEPGHQIKVSFTQLKLPERAPSDSPHLYLFDGDVNTPLANLSGVEIGDGEQALNVTTVSNRLIVVLLTGGKAEEDAVMYMEYAAHPGTCPDPGHPENGKLIAYNMVAGSTVAFRCNPGFVLRGEPRTECLPTGTWSSAVPTCVPLGAAGQEHQDIGVDVPVEHAGDSDLSAPFPVGPRGFTVPPTTSVVTAASPTKSSTSKTKTVPFAKMPSKSPLVKPSTAAPAGPGHPDDDLLDPIFHVSGHKPSIKEDHEWSKHHQQDIYSQDAQKGLGQPRKPSAHLDPRLPSVLPTPSQEEDQDVEPQSSMDSRTKGRSPSPHSGLNVTVLAVIVAVAAPLTIALLLVVIIVLYRRKYPVRMSFGRKFSTFENPMYVKKDAQDPRELTRLSADRDRF